MYVCALSTSLKGDYNEDSHRTQIYIKRFLKWNACPQIVHIVQLVLGIPDLPSTFLSCSIKCRCKMQMC